jgi:metal-dependent amidase/aminoacylase/carboxypeptidase family protein
MSAPLVEILSEINDRVAKLEICVASSPKQPQCVSLQPDAEAGVDYVRSYPVNVNHPRETDFAVRVASDIAGASKVQAEIPPVMGAEDFSFMLEACPGNMIFIGNGDTAGLHHPAYDFNDAAIPHGISYWARLVEAALPA